MRRRKVSDRGLQLLEKQKVRYTYGVLERQFRRFFAEAERRPGTTSANLLQFLERRLDNVVYRSGFADSRPQARQFVRHGFITLNGRKTDIPSCLVNLGDVITWKEGSDKTECYKQIALGIEDKMIPKWLSLDPANLVARVLSLPTEEEIEGTFDTKAIVEYYSR
jgi:small subunit ribosomal protein S4